MAGGNNQIMFLALLVTLFHSGDKAETIQIMIDEDTSQELSIENGVIGGDGLLKQMSEATKVLVEKAPDKVITLGDCSISQGTFRLFAWKIS